MYYEDRDRRFNLLSGLLFGAAVGAGLALLVSPTSRRLGWFGEDTLESLADLATAGRQRFRNLR